MSRKAHADSTAKLSHRDIQVYARQLVAITIEDSLTAGKFDLDMAFFNEQDQERIRKQLGVIIRQMDNADGKELPSQKSEEKGQAS
jgi:hypothetical protein